MTLEELYVTIIALFATIVLVMGLNYLFKKKSLFPREKIVQDLILFGLLLIGFIFAIFTLPITIEGKNLILTLLGIVIGALITFASTTFVANAMAGVMLRLIDPFKVGDFIKIDDTFGKVTEINFLQTQVQSIDRDLITIPNKTLVSNPLKTIRASGTIITASISLGYNIPRKSIEESILKAAEKSELENPFIHVTNLGDFSVTYKAGGLLKDVESLITSRSNFKKNVMDSLHSDGIEIVSPTFMNQRVFCPDYACMPPVECRTPIENEKEASETKTEEVIFDKAIEAQLLQQMYYTVDNLAPRRKEMEEKIKSISESAKRDDLAERIKSLQLDEDKLKFDILKFKDTPDITSIIEDSEKEKVLDLIKKAEDNSHRIDDKFKLLEQRLQKLVDEQA
jgi:small conductance mechanosensitive channel